jgi:hypothetical protein
MRYRRRADVSETAVEEDLFLHDPLSRELYHLDRTARALWTALAEPHDLAGLTTLFAMAFPDAASERIGVDLETTLAELVGRGLVVSVP